MKVMTYMRTNKRLTLMKELQAYTDNNPLVDVNPAVGCPQEA